MPSWQQPAHTQGWQGTSWVTSSLPLAMGIFHTSAEKRVLKQTNKSVYKYLGLRWMMNFINLALGLTHQPFLVSLPAQQLGAGQERFHMYTHSRRAVWKHTPELHSPAISSWLRNSGYMLFLKHVNHLFHSWHPQHHLGSPEASCCTWDPPDKGAVINLSETTVFHTQENTVDELFITMLPTSSTTAEPNT